MLMLIIAGFLIMLIVKEKYKYVSFIIIGIGCFSIGIYSIDFGTMTNRFYGYILSWITLLITSVIVYYVGNKIEFYRNNPVLFDITVATAIHRIITFIIKIIFNVPNNL